ncbi:Pyridoxal-phosphate dependent enzyme [Dillenia turbinata]|uniref:Threonine dehydratase n=1 Tax=Dillenia turbinata TaxID=194707 RepID=A0AAN8W0T5_9MAGN
MESLCLRPAQFPLHKPKHHRIEIRTPQKTELATKKKHVTIRATASKSTAEISLKPSISHSRETPLHSSSSASSYSLKKLSADSLQYESGFLGAVPNREEMESGDGVINAMGYLTNILSSKVFSFKLRGAYNMMVKLPKEQLERGVICSSAGNHAQGVALAAQRLGCNAVIAMPVTTPEIKWKSVKRLGATVVLLGDSYDEAQAYAKQRAVEEGRTFIPPFDDPDVIMGQGTVGMEIVRQMQGPLHAIFVPVGGGGLIAGIAAYVKRVSPEVKVIGVEPFDANAMALSLHHGQRIMLDQVGGFADGVAVKVVGEETFRLCKELVDGVVLVSRDAICASIKDMFEEKRSILEPAGALALAGAEAYCKYYGLKDENIVAITSGANMNFDRLRLVTELADVGRQREAVLATFMPEEPGSFKKFCEQVGPMNITEFNVGVHTVSELNAMVERMKSSQLRTINLTDNDLVKDHLRHLMGGRSQVPHELLCRFVFPERPGALMKFLDAFSPRWNISLFHYRGQGETGANVLVGIQVAQEEMDEFLGQARSLRYEFAVETSNNAFKFLMH